MKEQLITLHKNAYVPISNFPVSACVVTKDDSMFFGVNVEDASTRAGTCAERNAITNGEYKIYTVEELCPYPFGEDDLK